VISAAVLDSPFGLFAKRRKTRRGFHGN